jgi:hypothetical protein
MGVAMIVPSSLKTKGGKQFQDRQIFILFFIALMNPLYLLYVSILGQNVKIYLTLSETKRNRV